MSTIERLVLVALAECSGKAKIGLLRKKISDCPIKRFYKAVSELENLGYLITHYDVFFTDMGTLWVPLYKLTEKGRASVLGRAKK